MLRRLTAVLFMVFLAVLLPGVALAEEIFIPLVEQAKDYPDLPDTEFVTVSAVSTRQYQGCTLTLTNVLYHQDDDEFEVTNKVVGGTVEVDCPSDRVMVSFTAIDWDVVLNDSDKWTKATFTLEDSSTWWLKAAMENNQRRLIEQGTTSDSRLIIRDENGQPTSAEFRNVVKIHVQPGTHRTGDRLDSTWFSFTIIKHEQPPKVCPAGFNQYKFDSPFQSGTIGPITVVVTEFKEQVEPIKFDFTSTEAVWFVYVKGGPTTNDYNYDPPVLEDQSLTAPDNKGISNAVFCTKPAPPPPPAPKCTNVNADINNATMEVTGTGSGENAVAWRVVRVSDQQVMDSGSGASANFSFTGEYDTQYQLQFQGESQEWSTEGCTFKFQAPPPPPAPSCTSVNPTINNDTMEATGTGSGDNAVAWRVVRKSDNAVMDSGTGNTADFSFTAEYEVNYQLQFQNSAGIWSSEDCLFVFNAPPPPPPAPTCTMVDAFINEATMQVEGTGTGQNAVAWRVIRVSDGNVMDSGSGAAANFSFTGEFDSQYQLQFQGEDESWSSEGCTFSFQETPPPPWSGKLYLPFAVNQKAGLCTAIDASIPSGANIQDGTSITIDVFTENVKLVKLGGQEVVPTNGKAIFQLQINPGIYTPEVQALHGTWSTADNCQLEYKPFPTQIKRVVVIYADPEYVVEAYEEDEASLNWQTGQFETELERDPDGSYTVSLTGPIGEDLERHAFSAGLSKDGTEMVFRFQQLYHIEDDEYESSFVFHNEFAWNSPNASVALTELGSYEWGDENDSPIMMTIRDTNEQSIPWSVDVVSQGRYLADGSLLVPGVFSDYRNEDTPAFGILNGCLGVVALREQVPSDKAPRSGKFMIVEYEGDCAPWDGGYLAPLLDGSKRVADPNAFKRPTLVPQVGAMSLSDEVRIEMTPIALP